MPIKYIPYSKNPVRGQAILNNITRSVRLLSYKDNDKVHERILRGIPYYELKEIENIGETSENLVIRGECLSACAYLKEQDIKVDLVYIDPPFASGADYAKKVYIRKNPKLAEKIKQAEEQLELDELVAFEEKMYGDIWNKEDYLNWMYENLMAIKEVMSESASIFVHLDGSIGHYVKILMDEVFGDENFVNEIIWYYSDNFQGNIKGFANNHDNIFWYSNNKEDFVSNKVYIELGKTVKRDKRIWSKEEQKLVAARDENGKIIYIDFDEKKADDVWSIGQSSVTKERSKEYIDYATQKPEALLERIIKASSNENMTVCDFFGGSGVTAKVANDLGRKFIHCDIGINSIQTVRDRLVEAGTDFKILEVQDGINLFRNPTQTMDKLASMIDGLNIARPEGINSFWFGVITDSKHGTMPVYVPTLKDSTKKVLDIVAINEIINGEIHKFDNYEGDIKKIIVYFVDIEDEKEIKKFIRDNNETMIEVELRDLKSVLDFVVVDDIVEFSLDEKGILFEVKIESFYSDRLKQKINDFNSKKALSTNASLIEISKEGLELIEYISLDCTNSDGMWKSDSEIKIDKNGFVSINGTKTKEFWNGLISSNTKPKRVKVRNIAGDEVVVSLNS